MSFIRKFVKGIYLFIDPGFPGSLFNASDKTDAILTPQLIKRSHIIYDKFLQILYVNDRQNPSPILNSSYFVQTFCFLSFSNTKMCKNK